MEIVFRADGSVRIGGGHLMRCLTLADELTRLGHHCFFACRVGSMAVVSRLRRGGYGVFEFPEALPVDAEPAAMAAWKTAGCGVLVVDHYGWDVRLERLCRGWADKILVIDDLANRPHECDWLLDQTLGRQRGDYLDLVPAECRLLLGVEHLLLRPEFARYRGQQRERLKLERVLVTLGMTDADNVTGLVLEGIVRSGVDVEVDVVLGSQAPFAQGVAAQLAATLPQKGVLHLDSDQMHALIMAADVVIGAGGTSAWERCCLGVPTITLVIAQNQVGVVAALSAAQAIVDAGGVDGSTPERVATILTELWHHPLRLQQMGGHAVRLSDGLGAPRTALALTMDEQQVPVLLRPVGMGDAHRVWLWQQEPQTRRFARNPNVPSWEEHQVWFQARLQDPGSIFHLILYQDQPAGVLRLDRLPDEPGAVYEVSIFIAPTYYRLGLARKALQMGRFLLPWAALLAWIQPENRASLGLFAQAGFRRLDAYRWLQDPLEQEVAS